MNINQISQTDIFCHANEMNSFSKIIGKVKQHSITCPPFCLDYQNWLDFSNIQRNYASLILPLDNSYKLHGQ